MALYTHELAESGSTWGIRGLGVLPSDTHMAEVMSAQNCLYSLTEKGTDTFAPQIIGSIIDYRLAGTNREKATSAIADPIVAIMSLTVTESGYAEPREPKDRTTFDLLAEGLQRRHQTNGGPLTILSCDNLPGNGDVCKRAMLSAANRVSGELAQWVLINCTFPNSMVDRITPTTADADRDWMRSTHGIDDQWPVVSEPFRQWVIEDNFAAGRPQWETVGALFTDDVHSWELYKLRLLNASHSCMAYLAALDGITYVDEAVVRPDVLSYLEELLYAEALPTLNVIPGHPREDYIRTVLGRYANTGVRDQIARLCMDGTAKYPTFLIPTIVRQLELNGPIRCATLALAGWARYLATLPVELQAFDASGEHTRMLARRAIDEPTAFLELESVFPDSLRESDRFRSEFVQALEQLRVSIPWTRD
jgi:mannitol 2-dehydrogenase